MSILYSINTASISMSQKISSQNLLVMISRLMIFILLMVIA